MNWKLEIFLLVSLLVYTVSTRQISHDNYKNQRRGLKALIDYINKKTSKSERGLNLLDDRTNKDISFLASETEWLKKTKSTPGKKSFKLNLMDDHNIPSNRGFLLNGMTPGKRCDMLDEGCSNLAVSNTREDSNSDRLKWKLNDFSVMGTTGFTSHKRCANLFDESCNNGYVPGTGDDSDWINGGNSPGKRSWKSVDDDNLPDNAGGGSTPLKRCANLLDESCNNGYVPGTGDDSDWINGGNSPGKRSWKSMDDDNLPDNAGGGSTPIKRCANLLDESCNNGYVPGTGDDSDWINGGNSPGKRALHLMNQNIPSSRNYFKSTNRRKQSKQNNSKYSGDKDWKNNEAVVFKRSCNLKIPYELINNNDTTTRATVEDENYLDQ